jgi:hypothetical protein
LPTADVDSLCKAQSERLQQMRGKLWTEIAGRADPSKVFAPSPELLNDLSGTVLWIEAREARIFALDAPTRQQIVGTSDVCSGLLPNLPAFMSRVRG